MRPLDAIVARSHHNLGSRPPILSNPLYLGHGRQNGVWCFFYSHSLGFRAGVAASFGCASQCAARRKLSPGVPCIANVESGPKQHRCFRVIEINVRHLTLAAVASALCGIVHVQLQSFSGHNSRCMPGICQSFQYRRVDLKMVVPVTLASARISSMSSF